MNKLTNIISSVCASFSAIIMLQTLYFKFTAAPESVFIFTQIGLEPFGRIGIGIAELFSSILILIPKTRIVGALMAIGLMLGALVGHLTVLGLVIMDDGGYLFALCLIVLIGAIICLYTERKQLTSRIKRVLSNR